MVLGTIACTGVPTAGGDALTAASLGLELELNQVDLSNSADTGQTVGLITQWDPSDNKVAFYCQGTAGAGNTLVAYTGDTANHVIGFRAVGKGSATA
jgi:hypothetical protein